MFLNRIRSRAYRVVLLNRIAKAALEDATQYFYCSFRSTQRLAENVLRFEQYRLSFRLG
jgi:hypothetical protein